jgi:hypothetical protein
MALGQVLLQARQTSVSIIPPMLHTHSHIYHWHCSITAINSVLKIHLQNFLISTSKLTLGMAADQHAHISVLWFQTNIYIERITNQKEMVFSLWNVGKLQGKKNWLQMAFSSTGRHWKLGSATRVTLLVHGTVPCFKTHSKHTLMECLHTITWVEYTAVYSNFFSK